jgi:hypothetical protein
MLLRFFAAVLRLLLRFFAAVLRSLWAVAPPQLVMLLLRLWAPTNPGSALAQHATAQATPQGSSCNCSFEPTAAAALISSVYIYHKCGTSCGLACVGICVAAHLFRLLSWPACCRAWHIRVHGARQQKYHVIISTLCHILYLLSHRLVLDLSIKTT